MKSLETLRAKMAAQNVPAVLVTDLANVAWLTEFSGSAGVALVAASDASFITDGRYSVQASVEVRNMDVRIYAPPVKQLTFLAENVARMGVKELGFESESVTVATLEDWKENLPGVALRPLKSFVSPLRMVKSASEVDRIMQVCGIADAAFQHVMPAIQAGVREYDVMLELELFMRRHSAASAFDIIVASGTRSALPHGRASEKVIEDGDFVTMDFGACKDGLNSDLTRTVVVGTPTDRHIQVYELVLKAQQACIDAMKPGAIGGDIDAIARKIFAEAGMGVNFSHGLGHGLGRLVHDAGRLGTGSTDVLEPGQVWTVEPGLYFDGWGGVRIEDDVLVTETGVQVLTAAPKNLIALPAR